MNHPEKVDPVLDDQPSSVEDKSFADILSQFEQDQKQEHKSETKVLTKSQKGGYKKRPRSVYGPDYAELPTVPKTVEMTV